MRTISVPSLAPMKRSSLRENNCNHIKWPPETPAAIAVLSIIISVSRLFSGASKMRPDEASGRFFVCVSVLLAET